MGIANCGAFVPFLQEQTKKWSCAWDAKCQGKNSGWRISSMLPDTQENKSKIPIRPERTKYLQRRAPFKSFLRAGGDFVVVEVFGGFALLSFRVALVH